MRHLRARQKALIRLAQLRVAQQKEPGVFLRQRARLVYQPHPHVLEETIALASIARAAASDKILPGALAPA